MWFHVMIKVEALWASELYFLPGRVHPAPGGYGASASGNIRLVRFELTLFYTQSKCLTRLGYNLIIK